MRETLLTFALFVLVCLLIALQWSRRRRQIEEDMRMLRQSVRKPPRRVTVPALVCTHERAKLSVSLADPNSGTFDCPDCGATCSTRLLR